MKTLYIHVGMPNVGSTTLQTFFTKNQAQLENQGIYYPTKGIYHQKIAHHVWAKSLKGPYFYYWWMNEDDPQYRIELIQANLVKDITASSCSKVLLSAEDLWHLDVPKKLGNLFKGSQWSIKILAYLRRQDDALISAYNQCVKTPDPRMTNQEAMGNIESFVQTELQDPQSIFCLFPMLSRFAEVFGQENIIVRVLERDQLVDGDLLKDALKVLGLSMEDSFEPVEDLNTSQPQSLIDILYLLNKRSNQPRDRHLKFNWRLRRIVQTMHLPDYPPLSPAMRRGIMDHFREDNAKVAKEFLGRADGQLFLNPEPDLNEEWTLPPEISAKTMACAATHFWKAEQERLDELRTARADLKERLQRL